VRGEAAVPLRITQITRHKIYDSIALVSDPGKLESCPIPAGIREDLRVGGPSFVATRSRLPQVHTSAVTFRRIA
jgi:hypothetical protein